MILTCRTIYLEARAIREQANNYFWSTNKFNLVVVAQDAHGSLQRSGARHGKNLDLITYLDLITCLGLDHDNAGIRYRYTSHRDWIVSPQEHIGLYVTVRRKLGGHGFVSIMYKQRHEGEATTRGYQYAPMKDQIACLVGREKDDYIKVGM